MTTPLLAANRMQSDMAGLTGQPGRTPTGAATSPTEAISALVHGESGSLGFLFDNPFGAHVVADPLRPLDQRGPHGGAGHPDTAGTGTLNPTGLGPNRTVTAQPNTIGEAMNPAFFTNQPPQAPSGPQPSLPEQAAQRARDAISAAQERISGLFGSG